MKKLLSVLVLILIIMLPLQSNAKDIKPYVGLGIGYFFLDVGGPIGSTKVSGGFAQIGLDFMQNFGAELRLGVTDNSSMEFGVKFGMDNFFSYLLKAQIEMLEVFRIYVLGGGSTTKVSVYRLGMEFEETKSSGTFG